MNVHLFNYDEIVIPEGFINLLTEAADAGTAGIGTAGNVLKADAEDARWIKIPGEHWKPLKTFLEKTGQPFDFFWSK